MGFDSSSCVNVACNCPLIGEELREEHQTYNLSPIGRVSLENINGGVQIKVWDRLATQFKPSRSGSQPFSKYKSKCSA
jgi:hypothetical protein